jgi:hypothetical protein
MSCIFGVFCIISQLTQPCISLQWKNFETRVNRFHFLMYRYLNSLIKISCRSHQLSSSFGKVFRCRVLRLGQMSINDRCQSRNVTEGNILHWHDWPERFDYIFTFTFIKYTTARWESIENSQPRLRDCQKIHQLSSSFDGL